VPRVVFFCDAFAPTSPQGNGVHDPSVAFWWPCRRPTASEPTKIDLAIRISAVKFETLSKNEQ
jgi:hypothetical protein